MINDKRTIGEFLEKTTLKPAKIIRQIAEHYNFDVAWKSLKEETDSGTRYSADFDLMANGKRYPARLIISKEKAQTKIGEEDVWKHVYVGPMRVLDGIVRVIEKNANVIDGLELGGCFASGGMCMTHRREVYRQEGTPDWFLEE